MVVNSATFSTGLLPGALATTGSVEATGVSVLALTVDGCENIRLGNDFDAKCGAIETIMSTIIAESAARLIEVRSRASEPTPVIFHSDILRASEIRILNDKSATITLARLEGKLFVLK